MSSDSRLTEIRAITLSPTFRRKRARTLDNSEEDVEQESALLGSQGTLLAVDISILAACAALNKRTHSVERPAEA